MHGYSYIQACMQRYTTTTTTTTNKPKRKVFINKGINGQSEILISSI
jgi:hypothetical protein